MRYITSDLHFGDYRVIKFRPFKNVNMMNDALIDNWNQRITNEDMVYILGDFSINEDPKYIKQIVQRMNGRKILVLENHDALNPFTYVDIGFESVHTSLFVDNAFLCHDPAWAEVIPRDMPTLCGHVHGVFKHLEEKMVLNVGVDVWDFKPLLLSFAIEKAMGGECISR
jgi:calcineurin-like phosphoesterase family protein